MIPARDDFVDGFGSRAHAKNSREKNDQTTSVLMPSFFICSNSSFWAMYSCRFWLA
jgi:hypothetical protein